MRLLFALLCGVALSGATYKVEPDVEYSHPGEVSLKLDAHVPEGKGPFPAVILVHGGGWTAGHKTVNFVTPLFPVLDQTGMAWFTIDYRLGPKFKHPAALEDVEAAVAFVKKNAKRFRVDPKRIALMGESAGGHLVNLAGARNRVGVAGVVCFYGPIDMVDFARKFEGQKPNANFQGYFGITAWDDTAKRLMLESSPRPLLNKKTPPFLIIHGTKDASVPYSQAELHVKLFRERGIPVELFTVTDGVHGVMNWEKDPKFHGYKAPMVAWLQKTLR